MKEAITGLFSKIFQCILTCIIAIPLIIVLIICFIVMLPIDYIKYKRSHYYKKFHEKYTLFVASGINFEIYNEILGNDLPIRFVPDPEGESLERGWFVFDKTLIIPNVFSFEYDSDGEKWNYCVELYDEDKDEDERVIMSLDEYIESEIEEANRLAGQAICNDAVVLIDSDCIENIDMAKKEDRFLVYENNREAALKQFCENAG